MKHTPLFLSVLVCLLLVPAAATAVSPGEGARVIAGETMTPTKAPPLRVVVDIDQPEMRRGLRAHDPIHCAGDEEITLSGVHIQSENDAIVVKGDCRVFITRSHLEGGRSAVRVLGQGDVTLRDTTLIGGSSALHIAGDGSVNASATTFRGTIVELGNGDLVGLGKNRYDD